MIEESHLSPANALYLAKLASHLPTASFDDARDAYQDVMQRHSPGAPANRTICRWLDRHDRFWLLTTTLRRKDAIHPWIYDRCREVERDPDGYLDLWSRGHYKSTIITFAGSIQEVLRNPEITIGIFSNVRPLAKEFLLQIQQELENNEILKSRWPDIFWQEPRKEAPTWSLDNGLVVKRQGNPKERTWEAHGLIDGMPVGRHYDLMIYDDVVTESSVATPDMIAKTTNRWELSRNLTTTEIGGA